MEAVNQRSQDILKLLAANSHLGCKETSFQMKRYIYKRNNEGVPIFNLNKTYEKLVIAARIIAAIENPADVLVFTSKTEGSRAVYKFCQYTEAQTLAGRWTPGALTNQITRKYIEPRVLIVADPRLDTNAIREAAQAGIPVIAFCNTDAPLEFVDVAIPCNNRGNHSIALMFWLLAREIQRLKGKLPRDADWEVMVDMFFFRDLDAEDRKKKADADEEVAPHEEAENWNGDSDWKEAAPAEE